MQKLTNKLFLFLILLGHTLYGCGLCTIYSPQTQVSIKVESNNKKIKTANITWVLTKEFTDQLKELYDGNQNGILDKDELKLIEESLLDYVVPKNHLTHISYGKTINKDKTKKVIVKSEKTFIKDSILHFNYVLNLNYDVVKGKTLYFSINDVNNYFVLYINELMVNFNSPFEYEENVDANSVTFYIKPDVDETIKESEKLEEKDITKTIEPKIKNEVVLTNAKDETLLSKFTKYIKEYLLKIQKGDNYALLMLLFISFIYGIIHALGPGHGKSLAFSYFTSNKTSYVKAFWISQASAFIHIIGALILVLISIFLLQSVLNNFVNDSVEILTKVSSIMIMLLAIYILYNKIKNNSCSCSSCCTPSNTSINSTWSTQKPSFNQNIKTTKTKLVKKDLYFVLTAGLIPCPGTVILFIYAFILKTYVAVLLASIFISLGMGLVIFMASSLGVGIHKVSEKSHKFTNILEISSPLIMFILGLLLFFNANLI